jgi:hypothetical protein
VRFLFLNQYFPPDPAPTGILLRELGDDLVKKGHEVEYIASGQNYRAAKKGSRMMREAFALVSMLARGLFARRADVVISGTSPPCLLFAAALIAKWHCAKSAHWAMDLYPELALALGELHDSFATRRIAALMRWAYRRTDLVVALDDDMASHLKKYGVNAEVIAPWLPRSLAGDGDSSALRAPSPEFVWIYSGNLGRAHEWATLLDAQALLEQRGSTWRLIFQGGGPSWPLGQERARELGLKNCEWKNYADKKDLRSSLLACHALIATQKPETRGLLWPSKLALLRHLPRPLVWIGDPDGAIARELRLMPHAGIFAPGQARELADWLENLGTKHFWAVMFEDVDTERDCSLENWLRLLSA